MYIVGADSAFDHDLEKALFNIKCNTLLLLYYYLILICLTDYTENKYATTDEQRDTLVAALLLNTLNTFLKGGKFLKFAPTDKCQTKRRTEGLSQ
jgi:hypothetical protein